MDAKKIINLTEMPELFQCYVIVPKFDGLENFPLDLFHGGNYDRDRIEFHYEQVIQGFDSVDEITASYAIAAIDELLTEPEMLLLRDFLADRYSLELKYFAVDLPIPNNSMAVTDLPTGGGRTFFVLRDRLNEDEPHNLPFRVMCWVDKRSYFYSKLSAEELQEMNNRNRSEFDKQRGETESGASNSCKQFDPDIPF